MSQCTYLDPLEPGTATPEGARWGHVAQGQMHVHLPESPLVRPWGGKQGAHLKEHSSDPGKSCSGHPGSPAIPKNRAWGQGARRNLLNRSSGWAAGVDSLGGRPPRALGLDCIYRDLLAVHRGCDRLTLVGCRHHRALRCGSFPMQIIHIHR